MSWTMIKTLIITGAGLIGSAIGSAFGGNSAFMTSLIIFMGIDILTGVAVSTIFKRSPKTESGALSSKTMALGLCRKGMMLLIVLIGAQLDIMLKLNYIRDAVIITFCANEILSIIENAGIMGLPMPGVISKAVELLQSKNEGEKNG